MQSESNYGSDLVKGLLLSNCDTLRESLSSLYISHNDDHGVKSQAGQG